MLASNPDGCQSCFGFGHGVSCKAAQYFVVNSTVSDFTRRHFLFLSNFINIKYLSSILSLLFLLHLDLYIVWFDIQHLF